MSLGRRLGLGTVVMLLATAAWLPSLHWFYTRPATAFRDPAGISTPARQLAARHLQLWTEPILRQLELRKMRASNAEWDFMGRSFLVWSLVNMGLREPTLKATYLPIQYQRARRELGGVLLGFGYAREWPASWQGPMDIDSGPIIPGLGLSAGSSGLAFVGASAFGDEAFLSALGATLDFAAFPTRQAGRLKYCASN
jgi:hypothetical protein